MDRSHLAESKPSISALLYEVLTRVADERRLTGAMRKRLMDIAAGLTYDDISREHGISLNTVKTEIRQLLRALGLYCRHEIDHAVEAAELRILAGATTQEIRTFLQLRWE